MLSPDENPFMTAHKPVEDGFPFEVETDSLATQWVCASRIVRFTFSKESGCR